MKIGIFETEHYESAYPVIQVFDTSANEIHLFTDAPTHQRLADLLDDTNRFRWTILYRGISRVQFFWQFYRQARKAKPDLLFFSTISSNHLLFALLIRLLDCPRTVLTVHDINCLFHDKPSWNIRRMVQYLGKRLLVRRIREYNVISDTMIPYLEPRVPAGSIIHQVPGAVFGTQTEVPGAPDRFHLVVPGTIDPRRRDYTQVWSLLQEAERRQFPLHVTLLGGYTNQAGRHILAEAREFPCYFTHIHYYDIAHIDQAEYDLQLGRAHFVFIPSVVHTQICHGIPEVYGVTKSSGNIFDVVKHARPFIVPAHLQIPGNLRSSAFAYQSIPDIITMLQSLHKDASRYAALAKEALQNSQAYSLEAVRLRNAALLAVPATASGTAGKKY